MQNVTPFLLIVVPFAVAFFLEALVLFYFRLRRFWASIGTAVAVNLLSLVVLYAASRLTGELGYAFNGMRLPLPVIGFLWWLSVIADGWLLRFFVKADNRTRYSASLLMNTISFFFLYFFVINTQ